MAGYNQGIFKPRNPKKYKGDPTNIVFRSSWELKFLIWLDGAPEVVSYSSEEMIVPYVCPTDGRWHRYFPDMVFTAKQADGSLKTFMVEIKPAAQTKPPTVQKKVTKKYINEVFTWGKNQAKWEAAKKYCDKKKWEFKILTEFDLYGQK